MGTGVYLLSMNRTRVTIAGEQVAASATVTVRGTEGRVIDRGAGVDLTMKVASVTRTRTSATVVGEDGTEWTLVRRTCGCGG